MGALKIAFVVDDTLDKPDGVQQYVLTLGEWFASQGHEVHYLAGASKRQDVTNIHSLSRNISVRFNGNRLSVPLPASKPAIRRLLERQRYDVLHVQMPYSPMLAQRVIQAAPPATAVIGTFHILPLTPAVRSATRLLGRWLRPSLRRFDRIFAVSPAAQAFARQSFRLRDCDVLPNVVDVGRFRDAGPFGRYDDSVPTIMFLGRLVPRKGCASLLKAAALLKEGGQPFRLVICGKGPLEAELKAMASRLGLDGTVEFTGFVEEADKPRYVASADVMVFPSSGGESFGIVLLEAMASGRPVVLAGDNEGYRSVMHERPQLLFPAADSRLLADKLALLLKDRPAYRETLRWQSIYVRQFDVAAVGQRLLAAYRSVLRNKTQS